MQNSKVNKDRLTKDVKDILAELGDRHTFVSAIEAVYAASHALLPDELQKAKRKLSSGVSDVKAYDEYLRLAIKSIEDHSNYRNYAPPQGAVDAREALAILESTKFKGKFTYISQNFCLTEGATGAISSLFEYFKKKRPEGELLIPCPSYYAFRLCATQYDIPYQEVIPNFEGKTGETVMSMAAIIDAITPNTKLIAITQPSNPTGEIYSPEDIRKLIQIAKKKDILIIFDELFADLIMDSSYVFTPSDKIALEQDALNNCVFIKAYSKNRNMPGFRIGYIYSVDDDLIEGLTKVQEQRAFCASGSNFKEIIILDSFYQTVDQLVKLYRTPTHDAIEQAFDAYTKAHISLGFCARPEEGYQNFKQYMDETLKYYQYGLGTVKEALGNTIDFMPRTKAAFNTMVRVKELDHVNLFDFSLNLFLFYGVKTQLGPYFGFNQKMWQDELGFWLRISFSMEAELLKEAAERFLEFKNEYLQSPEKFIHLNYEFK
jgi:aspartate/methionine/tyrosine aminotransferase